MSVPSVIFADANWYGSLRGGVAFGEGKDTRFADGNSRWGIKGSNELTDGLTATYRFEHQFSTENAGLARTGNILGAKEGRLANVGLSGGFGNLSLGTIWSASFNGTGAITDNSMLWGNSHTSYTVGNALSYSNSVGDASFQVDAIMDGARDTGDAVDQVEFGMSIGLGDIGKLAVSYVEKKDVNIMTMVHVDGDAGQAHVEHVPAMYYRVNGVADNAAGRAASDADDHMLHMITVMVPYEGNAPAGTAKGDYYDKDGKLIGTKVVDDIQYDGGKRVVGDAACAIATSNTDAADAVTACKDVTVYVHVVPPTPAAATSESAGNDDDDVNKQTVTLPAPGETMSTETYYIVEADNATASAITGILNDQSFRMTAETEGQSARPYKPASTTSTADIKPGSKGTHIAAEFGIGGVTAFLGHSTIETNGGAIKKGTAAAPMNKDPMTGGVVDATMMTKASDKKVTHAGVRGSVGDGGINYLLQYRSVDDAGKKSSPFLIHLSQSLGDGASAHIEHANSDDGVSGVTWVGLKVDF